MTDRKGAHLNETPRVARLLASLRGRLVRLVLLSGLGTVAAVLVSWLFFAFLADWGLRVPQAVRVLHGLVLLGLGAAFLWREVLRPLSRIPDEEGLALLVERARPELDEVLISAVQFQNPTRRTDVGDAGLVAEVLAEAETRAGGLDLAGALDHRGPRGRALAGLAGALALALFVGLRPDLASIFLDRMLGGSAAWPQRTHLLVELPGLAADAVVTDTEDLLRVRVARGTDVAVLVRAEGVAPSEVRLELDGGTDIEVPRSGARAFRTLLRSCQESLAFHAVGGDDRDGRPRVEIEVLQPPDVESVAVEVLPPPYSGLPAATLFDQDVSVLRGSRLRVHVLPHPRASSGVARLLPADVAEPLAPTPFPVDPGRGDGLPADPRGLSFETVASESFGFRVELTDARGLSNPDPGLFRVEVQEDRAPDVQVLAPSRTDHAIVRGGALPLRLRATDDFGLGELRWSVSLVDGTEEGTEIAGASFPAVALGVDGEAAPRPGERLRAALGSMRLEVDDLGTSEAPVTVDQRYLLEMVALDGREPEPNVGKALPVRLRVVTPEELLRRMQDRLARARMAASELLELQLEKRTRTLELVDSFDSDDPPQAGGDALALAAALSGQRRVTGDALALSRDLASVAEDILYARLDEKAGRVLERYDELSAARSDIGFDAAPWRALAGEVRDGGVASGGFAQNLVELVGLALEVAEGDARAAAAALDEAERALETASRLELLVKATGHQDEAIRGIESLLDELAEWDNFQNVLSLTRDILNRQKALRERTQKFASEK